MCDYNHRFSSNASFIKVKELTDCLCKKSLTVNQKQIKTDVLSAIVFVSLASDTIGERGFEAHLTRLLSSYIQTLPDSVGLKLIDKLDKRLFASCKKLHSNPFISTLAKHFPKDILQKIVVTTALFSLDIDIQRHYFGSSGSKEREQFYADYKWFLSDKARPCSMYKSVYVFINRTLIYYPYLMLNVIKSVEWDEQIDIIDNLTTLIDTISHSNTVDMIAKLSTDDDSEVIAILKDWADYKLADLFSYESYKDTGIELILGNLRSIIYKHLDLVSLPKENRRLLLSNERLKVKNVEYRTEIVSLKRRISSLEKELSDSTSIACFDEYCESQDELVIVSQQLEDKEQELAIYKQQVEDLSSIISANFDFTKTEETLEPIYKGLSLLNIVVVGGHQSIAGKFKQRGITVTQFDADATPRVDALKCCDVIVMITMYASHKIYLNSISTAKRYDIPFIYCNFTNVDAMCMNIYNRMKDTIESRGADMQ